MFFFLIFRTEKPDFSISFSYFDALDSTFERCASVAVMEETRRENRRIGEDRGIFFSQQKINFTKKT